MIITKGYMNNDIFEKIGHILLGKTHKIWQLVIVLIGLCFFGSMVITNDVALITFVPFTLIILYACNRQDIMIQVVVLQTISANLGSMLTPIGNPQNLYLYGISGMDVVQFIMNIMPFVLVSAIFICFISSCTACFVVYSCFSCIYNSIFYGKTYNS